MTWVFVFYQLGQKRGGSGSVFVCESKSMDGIVSHLRQRVGQ